MSEMVTGHHIGALAHRGLLPVWGHVWEQPLAVPTPHHYDPNEMLLNFAFWVVVVVCVKKVMNKVIIRDVGLVHSVTAPALSRLHNWGCAAGHHTSHTSPRKGGLATPTAMSVVPCCRGRDVPFGHNARRVGIVPTRTTPCSSRRSSMSMKNCTFLLTVRRAPSLLRYRQFTVGIKVQGTFNIGSKFTRTMSTSSQSSSMCKPGLLHFPAFSVVRTVLTQEQAKYISGKN